MDTAVLELLQCPVCASRLEWGSTSVEHGRIVEASSRCVGCGVAYAVQRGIALLLPVGSSRADLWEEAQGWLARLLSERPGLERALLAPAPDELAPADLFYRALVLEERGDFCESRRVAALADAGLYSQETRLCRERQLTALVASAALGGEPVVDVASGRGTLVERLALELEHEIVATDVSPHVLLRLGRVLDELGLGGWVSLVACDVRTMPFRDGVVATLTTHLGLANVTDPGALLGELRRIASARFLATTSFYPSDDGANGAEIRRLGLERLVYRDALLAELAAAGWAAEVVSSCRATAEPTPTGVVLEGAAIDALPVAETELEWALVSAR